MKSDLIAREIRERLTGEKNEALHHLRSKWRTSSSTKREADDGDLVKVLLTRLDRVRAQRQRDVALKVSADCLPTPRCTSARC